MQKNILSKQTMIRFLDARCNILQTLLFTIICLRTQNKQTQFFENFDRVTTMCVLYAKGSTLF